MKFAMMYSCGKDSALALHRMMAAGHEPVCLIVTYNENAGRSWFHGVTIDLLEALSDSMGIPVVRCVCTGERYAEAVAECLCDAKELGAEAAAFGDIDIEGHLEWNREVCNRAGLRCVTPLWQESREALVHEMIDVGFKAVMKCVDTRCLDESFLGLTMDGALVERIAAAGVDVCGENGEYHTFVYDGPTYKNPVPIQLGKKIGLGDFSVIDMVLKREP